MKKAKLLAQDTESLRIWWIVRIIFSSLNCFITNLIMQITLTWNKIQNEWSTLSLWWEYWRHIWAKASCLTWSSWWESLAEYAYLLVKSEQYPYIRLICLQVCVNSFNILDPEMNSLGTGIYLAATIIDHSCRPNAVAVFEGTTIYIRATQDMPCLDWTKVLANQRSELCRFIVSNSRQVRICYIDLLNNSHERRAELKAGYYFLCDCPHCTDFETEGKFLNAMKCTVSGCDGPVPVTIKVYLNQSIF